MKNPVERLADTLIHGDSQKAALVFSEKNRRYFTQFPATDGALLVTAEEAYLLMDFRYEEAARYKAQYCTVVGFDSLMGKLQELLQKHGVQEVYMECEQLSVADVYKRQGEHSTSREASFMVLMSISPRKYSAISSHRRLMSLDSRCRPSMASRAWAASWWTMSWAKAAR